MTQNQPQQPRPIRDIQAPGAQTKRKPKKLSFNFLGKLKALKRDKKRLKTLAGVVIILLVAAFLYSYMQTRNELKRISDPQAAMQEEAKKLAGEVGTFLELPQDETPSVATVKNQQQLQGLLFFERAQPGDKVLIYPKAKRAVLYRPSTRKVIEYAPVEDTNNQ